MGLTGNGVWDTFSKSVKTEWFYAYAVGLKKVFFLGSRRPTPVCKQRDKGGWMKGE